MATRRKSAVSKRAVNKKAAVKKRPAAAKNKSAAKRKTATKRKISTRRNSPSRQRALDTALMMGGEMAMVPAAAAHSVIRLPAQPKPKAKPKRKAAAGGKSLGQRLRKFVEKQLG